MGLLPDGPIDTLGVFDAIQATPESVAAALGADVGTSGIAASGIVLVASGADALVASAAQTLVAAHSPVPVFVHDATGLPAFVSDEWLVIAVSRSTEVTDQTALHAAVDRNCALAAIGSGPDVETAAERGAVAVRLMDEAPAPRFAFGSTLVATLRLLDAEGAIIDPLGERGLVDDVDAAVAQLEQRRRELDGAGDAAMLARRIGRTMPLIYAAGPLGELAARRWKCQVNENAKAPAFSGAMAGIGRHELNGWGQHGDMTRQVFTLVNLRHGAETVEEQALFRTVDELMDEVVSARYEVEAEGDGPLAQLLDLVYVGDLMSYHLAQVNEIDPGPTAVEQQLGT